MANFIYQKGLHQLGPGGDLNIETASIAGEIYTMLLDNSYVPDQGLHNFVSDIRAFEIPAGGVYVANGLAHASSSIEVHRDNVLMTDQVEFQTPVTWSLSTITAAYAVTYQKLASDATSPILWLWDFDGIRTTVGRDFVLSWLDTVAHVFGPCP